MIHIAPLPTPLRMLDPAVLIATGFGSGRLHPAPGTWGSLAAWIIGIALMMSEPGKGALLLAFVVSCGAGWWAIEQFEHKTGLQDSGMIVIDEWAGLWLAMLFAGPHPLQMLLCLILFRLFDIWKPGPIGWLDKNVHGPIGVMLDDLAAGALTALCVALVGLWIA